ncbi:hypothetical protein [Oceanobacillus halophilus]|uniref:Uncharacterized protein n=1 Tax=Oceanobacillus halophilus TaxID=930130 RepID=A0A495A278_9BACI|nr:hypothetical protein [Oceanobacillus halophilus]RKQ33542.1 hypothetical protein D8M06_10055 [Oceanobacillus halophilus]
MTVIDFQAAKKWSKIPKNLQEKLLQNVFCPKCGVTKITDYSLNDDEFGIILDGSCSKCGKEVSRLVEEA